MPGGRGTLFVVATPIGNLRDVTHRALDVLGAVPLIAAEDTRLSRRLLDRYEIKTRTLSYHARSGPARREELLELLRGGTDLALVTDAGTPGVSDPGDDLVAAWAAEDGLVVPIPGPSAVIAAVAASGVAGARWGFEGFLPRRGAERRARIARISSDDRATILFEAPTRLAPTLGDLAGACGPARPAAVCRELTKLHEQIVRKPLGEQLAAVEAGLIPSRGEIVIVVAGRGPEETTGATIAADDLEAAAVAVSRLVSEGLPRSEAVRRVAAETGTPRRRLYAAAGRSPRSG